ncbi:hypothetical protein K438DRAFT_1957588 [Mycena galopus ATCC 62051]|nr:hypothetical protein K438DRAFT_1957588 [Mycena galopus ATCC 62051]
MAHPKAHGKKHKVRQMSGGHWRVASPTPSSVEDGKINASKHSGKSGENEKMNRNHVESAVDGEKNGNPNVKVRPNFTTISPMAFLTTDRVQADTMNVHHHDDGRSNNGTMNPSQHIENNVEDGKTSENQHGGNGVEVSLIPSISCIKLSNLVQDAKMNASQHDAEDGKIHGNPPNQTSAEAHLKTILQNDTRTEAHDIEGLTAQVCKKRKNSGGHDDGRKKRKHASHSPIAILGRFFDWIQNLLGLLHIWAYSIYLGVTLLLGLAFRLLAGRVEDKRRSETVLYILRWPFEMFWVNYFWFSLFVYALWAGPGEGEGGVGFHVTNTDTEAAGARMVDRAARDVKRALGKWASFP